MTRQAPTVPVLSDFKAMAGNNLGVPVENYFSKEITFSTMCSDKDLQIELEPASAPTLTIVNDDRNHEKH